MTPEERAERIATVERRMALRDWHLRISFEDAEALADAWLTRDATLRAAVAEQRELMRRITALEAALRDVLDEIGPCSDEKKAREFSRYDIDTARAHLEHTIAEARQVLETR